VTIQFYNSTEHSLWKASRSTAKKFPRFKQPEVSPPHSQGLN